MNLLKSQILAFSIVSLLSVNFCFGEPLTSSKVVGPDVTWSHQSIPDGPLNYNILRINLANPLVTLETESAHDAIYKGEKVLDSAKREAEPGVTRIVGGVNADFWGSDKRSYTPLGLFVADGMIYNTPSQQRSSFVLTKDEKPFIGRVTLKVSLQNKTNKLAIDNINSPIPGKNIGIYTPPYGSQLGPAVGSRYILTMKSDEFLPNHPIQVQVKQTESNTTTSLVPGTIILQIPSKYKYASTWLKDGSIVTLSAMMPEVMGTVASVCGGGPVVVENGKPKVSDDGNGKVFAETKHPRTAVGYSKDGKIVYLLTVDGRQPKISIGSSLKDLAIVMTKLGCWRAMNLDGGGSTTMVVNDKIVNKPSDLGGPRTVANSLLIVEDISANP